MTRAGRGARARKGQNFGHTWWGAAWIEALEDRAQLDPNRLPRGRTYARHGRVGDLDIDRGEVRAAVRGSAPRPYAVRVRIRPFTAADWEVVLNAIGARAAHVAALLDGELLPAVVDDVAEAGLSLLPGAGEVGPRCSCPDWADPCKHAAAVCYLVADTLDADPFAVFLLRGLGRDELLARLRGQRAASLAPSDRFTTKPDTDDPGVEARLAFAKHGGLSPAPRPATRSLGGHSPPRRPGRPAVLAVDPPPDSGLQTSDLVELAADAARRAWELCTGENDGGLQLSPDADLARRAAACLGRPTFGTLAARAGVAPRALVRMARAWEAGGEAGVGVLGPPRGVSPEDIEEARAAAAAAAVGQPVRVTGDRVTAGALQLRLGVDGRWYPFTRAGRRWELSGDPDFDPTTLLRQMLT